MSEYQLVEFRFRVVTSSEEPGILTSDVSLNRTPHFSKTPDGCKMVTRLLFRLGR